MVKARRIRRGTGDDPFSEPSDFARERARLRAQNELLWKKFGDLQFGPRVDGVRNPKLARPIAAKRNAELQLKNSSMISQIDKWFKMLKK